MVIKVVSKMVAPRTSTGTSHAETGLESTRRSFNPSVAIRKPRNIAPPSPIKIFAGLKFQRKKSGGGAKYRRRQNGHQCLTAQICQQSEKSGCHRRNARAQSVHVIQNAERGGDAHDPDDR